MNLNTPEIEAVKNQKELYHFLSDFTNFSKLMPKNTETFELTDNGFLFALKGMPTIKLKLQEKTPYSKIVLASASDQFPFTLTANIKENGEKSKVNFVFEGKFNP
ncbi:MAG TPA: SRPBCC family protein, partial [Flavobacteriia bacterium]|nr:SRPBCC family protein [Flavobacteriia bacterium]